MIYILLAEREGFDPPVPLSRPVFKTGVIDHPTISPKNDKCGIAAKFGYKVMM